jgi:hypothetical protein
MMVRESARESGSMFTAVLAAILIASALAGGCGRGVMAMESELDQYRWKNRLLFVFAATREDPSFVSLHDSVLARHADVADRDLVVFEVLDSGLSTVDREPLDPDTVERLRKKFGVSEGDFSVILVGKDGGVKLERHDRTSLEEIFALIDSMPMRQEEMRRKRDAETRIPQ